MYCLYCVELCAGRFPLEVGTTWLLLSRPISQRRVSAPQSGQPPPDNFQSHPKTFSWTLELPNLTICFGWPPMQWLVFIGPRSNNCLTDWCCCQTKLSCCKVFCQNCQMWLYKVLQSFKVVTGICQSSCMYLWKLPHVFVKAVKEWANRITLSVC